VTRLIHRIVATVAVLSAMVLVWSASVGAATIRITLRAEDGVTVAGIYHEPAHAPAPAIILLPMLGRRADDWQAVVSRLGDAGFAVIAIDTRAETVIGETGSIAESRAQSARMLFDVRAARRYLAGRSEVSHAIGLAGASVGANLAMIAGAEDPTVRSVVLLSPGLDYLGLKTEPAMRKFAERPALLIAGANDPYARRSIAELAKIGPGLRDVRTSEAGGHGTVMLARSPDLVTQLVDWFQRTLL
jgi:dienelactone hydrolase